MKTMRSPILLLLLLLGAAPARASDGEARRHFDAGIALAQQHDFEGAIGEFETSYRLNPLPEMLFDIALSQRALGRSAEAVATLRRYVAEGSARGKLPAERRAEAEQLIAELEATLRPPAPAPAPAPAPVPVPAPVPAAVPAPVPAPREAPPLVVAPPPARAETRPPLLSTMQGRAALGLGVGALVLAATGAVTGGVVLSEKATYHDTCATTCDGALYDQARRIAITTDVLFSVAGAAAISSLVLFLVRPTHRSLAALIPRVGPRGLTFQGAF